MKFYLVVPHKTAALVNPFEADDVPIVDADGKPVTMSWAQLIKAFFADERIQKGLDMLDAYDLRKRLISADEGAVVELQEAEKSLLADVARRPTTLTAAFRASPEALDMTRAFIDVSSREPKARPLPDASTSPTNGARARPARAPDAKA